MLLVLYRCTWAVKSHITYIKLWFLISLSILLIPTKGDWPKVQPLQTFNICFQSMKLKPTYDKGSSQSSFGKFHANFGTLLRLNLFTVWKFIVGLIIAFPRISFQIGIYFVYKRNSSHSPEFILKRMVLRYYLRLITEWSFVFACLL